MMFILLISIVEEFGLENESIDIVSIFSVLRFASNDIVKLLLRVTLPRLWLWIWLSIVVICPPWILKLTEESKEPIPVCP